MAVEGKNGNKALLIEDDPGIRYLLERVFENIQGWEVTTVDSGTGGIAEWEKGGYSVIIVDLQMPVMDGFETTGWIRKAEERGGLAPIPIIAFSAHVDEKTRRGVVEAGMDGFIAKPLHVRELLAALARHAGDT